jgi:hypothetical protein
MAYAESCVSYLQKQYLAAKHNAGECGASAQMIASIDTTNVPDRGANCGGSLASGSQLSAFNACARTYYCASFAYKCALQRVRSDSDCQGAMSACVTQFPIPK